MRKRAVRLIIGSVVLAGLSFAAYQHFYKQASGRVKTEILKLPAVMTLLPGEREQTRRLINAEHENAFKQALDLTYQHGQLFDTQRYVDVLFDRIITQARNEGFEQLANSLKRERKLVSFEAAQP